MTRIRFDPFSWLRDPRVAILLRKVNAMSEASDALNKKVDDLAAALANIRGDITEIKNNLPTGGMTADEVAALSTKLDTVVADAQQLDSENPAAPTA